jgi:hypothetical protein
MERVTDFYKRGEDLFPPTLLLNTILVHYGKRPSYLWDDDYETFPMEKFKRIYPELLVSEKLWWGDGKKGIFISKSPIFDKLEGDNNRSHIGKVLGFSFPQGMESDDYTPDKAATYTAEKNGLESVLLMVEVAMKGDVFQSKKKGFSEILNAIGFDVEEKFEEFED